VKPADRKALVRAYKESGRRSGVFAFRCAAAGEAWVASSNDLQAQPNGTLAGLRLGSHPNKRLQALWAEHGPDAFNFEILEEVDGDGLSPQGLALRLKDRAAAWRETLGAGRLTG
jgi:hypothetical protein